jgi:capsular exopolysaccharide synthesis family protein
MEPIDFLRVLRRRWKILALALVIAGVVAWVTTPSAEQQTGPPVTSYTATSTLLQEPGSATPLGFIALLSGGGRIPEVAAETIGYEGDPAVLASQVTVTADSEYGLLSVTSSGSEGEPTAELVNAYSQAIRTVLAQDARDDRQQKITEITARIAQAQRGVKRTNAALKSSPGNVALQAELQAYTQQVQAAYLELTDLYSQTGNDSGLSVYQEATPIPVVSQSAFTPPSSRTGRMVIALGAALALGLVLILLLDRLDTRLRRRQDVEEAFDLPVVAEVPKLSYREQRRHRVAALSAPVSPAAESYRSLRSALSLMRSRPIAVDSWAGGADSGSKSGNAKPQVVLVTSARSGEGKSTSAANLAVTLAETGQRVLLLDADFRNPSLHSLLDVSPGPGLADLLVTETDEHLSSVARPTSVGGVRLVTGGNCDDFLGVLPGRLAQRVDEARKSADVVVIDAAPLLVGNDSLDFMPFVDSVIVVARAGRVTREMAERSSALLARVRVPVLGVVLIGAPETPGRGGWFGGYGSSTFRSSGRHRTSVSESGSEQS